MLEEFYALNQRMNLSISECKRLPVIIRKWYIQKIVNIVRDQSKKYSKSPSKTSSQKVASGIDISKVDKFFAKFEK